MPCPCHRSGSGHISAPFGPVVWQMTLNLYGQKLAFIHLLFTRFALDGAKTGLSI